jgi:serine/threonine-protein kinase
MGEIYAVDHVRMRRRFALKLLRADLAAKQGALGRFEREVIALASVRSPHVVDVVDCGELDGIPFIVMELLAGEDLQRVLERSQRLRVARAVRLGMQACFGLAAVHARGLVHRDIKPANLFLERGACGQEYVKLLDFGVAKLQGSDVTRDKTVLGTLRYIAPEQLLDSAAAESACDVYALGAVLYHCLSGEPPHAEEDTNQLMFAPHAEEDTNQLMFAILNREVAPLSARVPNIPSALEAALLAALSRQPEQRPTAEQLAMMLSASLSRIERSASTAAVSTELSPTLSDITAAEFTSDSKPTPARPNGLRQGIGAVVIALGGIAAGVALGGAHQKAGEKPASVNAHSGMSAQLNQATSANRSQSPLPSATATPSPLVTAAPLPSIKPPPRPVAKTSSPPGANGSVRQPPADAARLPLAFDQVNPYTGE